MWVVIPILFVFFRGYNAYAVGLQATVDKTEATLEDQIILTVSVSGLRGLNERPELPPLPDFVVNEGGTSSRTEIINGQVNSSIEFTYALSPRRSGRFAIGPVTLTIRGETYKSTPVMVTILSAEHPAEGRPEAYITQEIDTTTPYMNQQIIYTFRFLSRVQTMDAQLQPPSFQGFWTEDLGKERHYQRLIGGIPYSVTEIKKALFPMNTGPSQIEESLLTCKLLVPQKRSRRSDFPFDDSFFSNPFFRMEESVTRTLHAEPIHLEVRPLPREGRPQDFKGLVGEFRIRAELGQSQLKAGDSTTLTITVQGRGNLRDLTDVSMQNLATIKIYPDNPSFQMEQVGDYIEGTKVFKKALVPLQEGPLEIPPLKVVYFEPVSGTYTVAKTEALKLSVLRAPEKEGLHMVEALSPAGQKMTVRSLGEDILPIHTALSPASSTVASSGSLWIAVGMFLAPPLAFFSSLGIKRRKDRLELDRSYARRKEAGRNAGRELGQAKRRIAAEGDREFYRELSRCIKGFIGDKENLSALALTPPEIDQKLRASGLKPELSQAVRELLEELEYCQYVTSQKTVGEREALFKRTKKILAQLNNKL
jgi:hypothetical protein